MTKREQWIDQLKGFAIICVVLGHSIERTLAGLDIQSTLLANLDYFIYSFHMPLFFLISGYVYAITGRIKRKADYVKNKIWDLLVPYVFFAVLVWGGKMVFASFVTYNVTISDLLMMFLNPIAFLWFIYILFFVSILVYLLEKSLNGNTLVVFGILLMMCLARCFITTDIKLFDRLLFYPMFYYLGVVFFEYKKYISWKIVGLSFCIFLAAFALHYNLQGNIFLTILVNLFGSLFFTCLFFCLFEHKAESDVLGYFGTKTMYIYILHPIIVNAARVALICCKLKNAFLWILILLVIGLIGPLLYEIAASKIWILDMPFRPRVYLNKYKIREK